MKRPFWLKELIFIALSLLISFATFYFYRFVDTCPSGAMCFLAGEYYQGFPFYVTAFDHQLKISYVFNEFYIRTFIINTLFYLVIINLAYFGYKKFKNQKNL